jgi:hypothetical protein
LRLKASIWVNAYIRRLGAVPIPAMVVKRGDSDAGAIFIKINRLDGSAQVLRPAFSTPDADGDRAWTYALASEMPKEPAADAYLARQADFDSDMWVIEIEDRRGRHGLDEFLISE